MLPDLDVIESCLPALLGYGDIRIAHFAKRDILGEDPGSVQELWNIQSAAAILRKQLPSGSWRYANARAKKVSPLQDYDQLETYRRLGQLVEQHGFDKTNRAIERAAEFLFDRQTDEGDFRGIYGRQYTPNYTAGIVELLVKAGYGQDARIKKAFAWLLSVRQEDGGWAIPIRTAKTRFPGRPLHHAIRLPKTMEPDLAKASSAMVTGIVLRAFAAHEGLNGGMDAYRAARLLSSKFFKRDAYADRGAPEYWEKMTFLFWFTDIVSALDSLCHLKPEPLYNDEVLTALRWIMGRQSSSGLFEFRLLKTGDRSLKHWESLAVCRILKRYSMRLSRSKTN
jgi:squalene-hopene cyclase-like protein